MRLRLRPRTGASLEVPARPAPALWAVCLAGPAVPHSQITLRSLCSPFSVTTSYSFYPSNNLPIFPSFPVIFPSFCPLFSLHFYFILLHSPFFFPLSFSYSPICLPVISLFIPFPLFILSFCVPFTFIPFPFLSLSPLFPSRAPLCCRYLRPRPVSLVFPPSRPATRSATCGRWWN